MISDKKINAIADAEQAGLYYSSNTEPGYTRKVNEKEMIFLPFFFKNSSGSDLSGIIEKKILLVSLINGKSFSAILNAAL